MSLGAPVLYIAGRRIQTGPAGDVIALANPTIKWGTDSQHETAPPANLSGELLIPGAMPSWLNVGAPVGLVDPASSRCLFAGTLEPLTANPDQRKADAYRVGFTAASPSAELQKHRVLDIDWPHEETAAGRFRKLAGALPRGWQLDGVAGWTWINQGRQKYQTIGWLTLAERYAAGQLQRIHDTSVFVPGAGLRKRITISRERPNAATMPGTVPKAGRWLEYGETAASTGVAVLHPATVSREITWEKTPADVITEVQITTTGGAHPPEDQDSQEFEYLMASHVDNTEGQNLYGYRQLKVETAISSFNQNSLGEAMRQIVNRWLDTDTAWRPTALTIPDSRRLDAAPLLNLLATDTRHMAAVAVPAATAAPGRIFAYALAGSATWTGTKWETELTLGKTL